MQTLINVGDEVKNFWGSKSIVTSVDVGRHGLLVKGEFELSYQLHEFYAPFELPPESQVNNWYGWRGRSTNTLPNGLKFGVVSLRRSDGREDIEEYDLEWERTIELMRKEDEDVAV